MVIVKTAVPGVSPQALARFTQRACKAAGLRGQVNVMLASSREVRVLNRRFRGKDAPTDVLSFPPAQPPVRQRLGSSVHFLGDIVICSPIAVRNARLFGHLAAQELRILILHGLLHLAGYDHERDSGRMARREERLRRQLGLSNGLIRRTTSAQVEAPGFSPAKLSRKTKRASAMVKTAQAANGQRPIANGPRSRR